MTGRGLAVLKIITVVMGVLIVGGTVTLAVLIMQRVSGPRTPAPLMATGRTPAVPGTVPELVLGEPAGSTLIAITAVGEHLAVHLHGGGPDRVLLIDPTHLQVSGRILLAP